MTKRLEFIGERIEREKRLLMIKGVIAFVEVVLLVCIFSLLVRVFGLTIV